MSKRFIIIYLPMVAVITIVILAAVQLYRDNHLQLNDVEFVAADVPNENVAVESLNDTEGIAEDAESEVESLRTLNVDEDAELIQDVPASEPVVVEEASASDTVEVETVIVTISGPGASIRCPVAVTDTVKVHALMKQASAQCDFTYIIKDFTSLGAFVDNIAGIESDKKSGKYWIYYVNGKKANVGVSSYLVQAGDAVVWKYEQEY